MKVRNISLCRVIALAMLVLPYQMVQSQCDADAGSNVSTCAGVGIAIGGSPTAVNPGPGPGVTYSWTPVAGLSDPTAANPIATPANTTTYTVTLSNNGCGAETDQVQVTVLPAPNANFTYAPNNTPCASTPIVFTNTTGPCPGCQYTWDFGDGSGTSNQSSPTHTFATAIGSGTQNFTVTLTVEGANGCIDTYIAGVLIKKIPDVELSDPITSFTNCNGDPNFALTVFDAGTTTGNTNYTIDWGDGTADWTSATAPAGLAHNYVGNDVFDLVYTVTGSNGCSVSETYFVSNITNPSIGAANPGGTQGCGPLNICFPLNNYLANHESTTYLVDFGDGSPTQLLNHPPPTEICHTYSGSSCATNPTGYTFSITATNNCDQSVATIFPVKVYSAPVAAFTATPVPACVNSTVTFINNSTPGYNNSCSQSGTYTWTFGDASAPVVALTLASQTHVYTAPGNYTVTLVAANACGNSTVSQVVCIEPAPTPSFTVNDNDGCFPMAVTTDNLSLSPNSCGTSTNWIVDYVDLPCDPDNGTYSYTGATNSGSLEPQFLLSSVGIYTIRLQMSNSCGIFEDNEVITVNTVPVVDVSTPSSVCVGTGGTPSGIVDGCNLPILSYAWSFPGGVPLSANTLAAPAISYPAANNYNVTLTATNACGPSSDVGVMVVLPAPNVQISASDLDNTICNGQAATLTATGAGTYTWSPGTYLSNYSGTGNTVQTNPTGTVTYTVTGTSGSCTDTGTITLNIDPLPTVGPSGTFEMCVNQTEQLGLTVGGGSGTYTDYSWSPNQNLTSNTISNPICNSTISINYTVSVTDDNGCVGTGLVPVIVNPLPPTNAGPDLVLCNQPVATQLTGFSPIIGGTGPGGSGTWSGANVTSAGVFTPAGVANIILTYCFTSAVTGCNACDVMNIIVTNPTPANAGPDTTICLGASPIQLPAGTWSGSPNITAGGLYTPTIATVDDVIVMQGNGSCATSDTTIVTILPVPVANAGMDTTICAGESVTLNGSCTTCPNGPPSFCTWTGGPSAPALSCNPTTGPLLGTTTYNLTLVDNAGCADPDQVTIFVNPLPNTNAGLDMTVCNQAVPTQLNGTPIGGSWSGTCVTAGGLFTPCAGTGVFTLTYCYTNPATGCEKCDDLLMTVISPTAADAGPNVNICLNQPAFNLVTTTPGGTWSGLPGTPVTGTGVFTPNTVNAFTVTYTQGVGSCLTTDNTTVTVNPLPTLNLGNDITICVNDSAQINAVIAGGTPNYGILFNFANWLTSASSINPIVFPPNTTTFTGTVTDANQCTATDQITVFVNGLPIVDAGADITVCDQQIAEVLTGFSPVLGGTGTWTGTGISDPTGEYTSPGVGTYWAYYTFTAGGNACSDVDSIEVTVIPPVIANAGPNVTLCLNEGNYQLVNFNPAAGGVWNGIGIIDVNAGIINTEIATVGSWVLEIENGTGTCYSSDQMNLTILPLPNVAAGPGAVVCGNADVFDLQGFIPAAGGTWEGPGITDAALGTFDPSIGTGNYDVFIWYTSPANGCSDTSYTVVNVSPVPVANFTVPVLGCTNNSVDINNTSAGATQYSWNFGNGDLVNGFEPLYTYPFPTEGVYDITLIAQNNFGCADTAMNANEIINPPVANLVIDPQSGCAPLDVTFDNPSTGLYTTFDWDLSITNSTDSIPASLTYLQGPDVVYYPITLTVSNFCGSDTDDDEITVLPQPVAGFGTNLDVDCSPFEVMFNNISTGLPDTFDWDFGDGTSSTLEEPLIHTYFADTIPVDYTIWLYLSNECGLDTASYVITVLPNTVTSFFNTNVTEGCEPLEVEFTDFSDGATQISYDLGDNNLTGNDNPTYTYSEGTFTIYQYADNGCSYDTSQITITVFPSPQIDFDTSLPNICSNNSVQFISEIDDAIEFEWTFGDGGISELSNPNHEYINGGNFVVTFTATNDNLCSTTVSHPFTVFNGPAASFTVPDQLGCSPFNLCFSNTAANGNFYTWDFGDGNTANSEDACNTFINVSADALLETVTLIVQDLQLCADTFQLEVIVAPQPVSAFTLSSFESCYYPQFVSATNLSLYANGYEWLVNGAAYSDILNPTFQFTEEGTYDIDLNVSNQFNCSATSNAEYTIHPLPVIDFTADPLNGCVPLTVNFTNNSTGAIDYLWYFGDGGNSSSQNDTHTYYSFGGYDVALVGITDAGCADTLEIENYVQAYRLPIADFHMDPEETDIYSPEITFFDDSQYATEWSWNFGDGNSSIYQNVQHTFPEAGYWNVTLTVWTNYGCVDSKHDVLTVNDIFNVFVPNTYTPDGDGINEVFLPKLTGVPFIETYQFLIFDRWGTVIFETNDPEAAWTGTVRDGAYFAKDDAYNWRILVQLKGSDKKREYNGHVILVR